MDILLVRTLNLDTALLCVKMAYNRDSSDDVHIAAVTPPAFQMKYNPSTSSKGGGVGIFYRNVYNVRPQHSHSYKSFEHMSARVVSGSSLYHVCLPSIILLLQQKNKLTFPMIPYDAVLTAGKLLIIGDFNIHMNIDYRESEQFKALLDTYNLSQHVSSPTYRRGRILDLVITRTNNQTIHDLSVKGPSDHAGALAMTKVRSLTEVFRLNAVRSLKNDCGRSENFLGRKKVSNYFFSDHNTLSKNSWL